VSRRSPPAALELGARAAAAIWIDQSVTSSLLRLDDQIPGCPDRILHISTTSTASNSLLSRSWRIVVTPFSPLHPCCYLTTLEPQPARPRDILFNSASHMRERAGSDRRSIGRLGPFRQLPASAPRGEQRPVASELDLGKAQWCSRRRSDRRGGPNLPIDHRSQCVCSFFVGRGAALPSSRAGLRSGGDSRDAAKTV
jgi:hypothetical protein